MTKVYPSFVAPSIACEVFGVTSQTLRRWAKTGRISFIKTPGGQYRYNVEGVIGAIQATPIAKAPARHPQAAPVVSVPAQATGGSGSGQSTAMSGGGGGNSGDRIVTIEMPQPKARPEMPAGVSMRSVDDDEQQVTMRDPDPTPMRLTPVPEQPALRTKAEPVAAAPVKPVAAKAKPKAEKPAPVPKKRTAKLDAAALKQKIESLASAPASV
jgi:excisionase family DNA binding protein